MVHDIVQDCEHYVRNVYCPRNVDESGILKDTFISLRTFNNNVKEDGVSGQILERAGEEEIFANGEQHIRKRKEKPTERYVGYACAEVGNIRSLAEDEDVIDVVLTESEIVAHAEIQFYIDGELLQGVNRNSRYLKYCDELKELLAKTIVPCRKLSLASVCGKI